MQKIEPNDLEIRSAGGGGEHRGAAGSISGSVQGGAIDFEVLKQLLGAAVDERDEKYGLNWHGKRRARQIALTPSTGRLLPCPEGVIASPNA